MNIPFEVIRFDDYAKCIKPFDKKLEPKLKDAIGGLPRCGGGGTRLVKALEVMQLMKQPENNKVCVVLTDGCVGDARFFDSEYFEPMAKKGAKSLAFGVETAEQYIKPLCMGTGIALKNAVEVPEAFSNILKSLILKR